MEALDGTAVATEAASAGAWPCGALGAGVVAVGRSVPAEVRTNEDLEKMVDTSDSWILERTGIARRHIAAEGEGASDLATRAATEALRQANMAAGDLALVIVGTVTADSPLPSAACLVQEKLGARGAACFDVAAGCSSFLHALALAGNLVSTGAFSNALVVGVDVLSRVTDWSDRHTCVLFGDGAGAVVVKPARPGSGILSFHLGSDGRAAENLMIPAGGSRHPASEETVRENMHTIKMNGREVFKMAVRKMSESIQIAAERAGCAVDEVDLLVPHQANLRIISSVCQRLSFPVEKAVVNIGEYGNTSSASIPLALADAVSQGRLARGDLVMLASFGAGVTWGAVALRWGADESLEPLQKEEGG